MSMFKKFKDALNEEHPENLAPWWDTPMAYVIAGALFFAIAIGYTAHQSATTPPPVAEADPVVVVNPNDINRSGLSKPVMQMVHPDGSCAGVVRADNSSDGDCTEASKDLPSITYEEVLNRD